MPFVLEMLYALQEKVEVLETKVVVHEATIAQQAVQIAEMKALLDNRQVSVPDVFEKGQPMH